jgi:cytochrome c551/c552
MKNKQLLTLLVLLGMTTGLFANPDDGKKIFTTRCAGCHNVNKKLTGPALAGVHERHSIEWIVQFVKSSQAVVKSGDKAAVALFQQFNRIQMPDHSDLSAENIKSIVDYIKSETVITDMKAPFAKPGKRQTAYIPLSVVKNYGLFLSYLAVVFLLIAILLLVVRVNSLQLRADDQRV